MAQRKEKRGRLKPLYDETFYKLLVSFLNRKLSALVLLELAMFFNSSSYLACQR